MVDGKSRAEERETSDDARFYGARANENAF
jgi:hypothetical protein